MSPAEAGRYNCEHERLICPARENLRSDLETWRAIAKTAGENEARLTAEVAELRANGAAYERIVGKKTYQEVADEIAILREENERLIPLAYLPPSPPTGPVDPGESSPAVTWRSCAERAIRERDAALAEVERVKGALDAARAYREEECSDTPRMWRGKKLQDLANELDDKLAALTAGEPDNACDGTRFCSRTGLFVGRIHRG